MGHICSRETGFQLKQKRALEAAALVERDQKLEEHAKIIVTLLE